MLVLRPGNVFETGFVSVSTAVQRFVLGGLLLAPFSALEHILCRRCLEMAASLICKISLSAPIAGRCHQHLRGFTITLRGIYGPPQFALARDLVWEAGMTSGPILVW
jgi:hypothetical protein